MNYKEFINYNNKSVEDFNPLLSDGSCLKDAIIKYARETRSGKVKYTSYDETLKQFVQHIYAIFWYKEAIEIVRRFETYPTIWRKAYFRNSKLLCLIPTLFDRNQNVGRARNLTWIWEDLDPVIANQKSFAFYTELYDKERIINEDQSITGINYRVQNQFDLLDYIKIYRDNQHAELFMKYGLYHLLKRKKALVLIKNDPLFREWIANNYAYCTELPITTIIAAYESGMDIVDYLKQHQLRIYYHDVLKINPSNHSLDDDWDDYLDDDCDDYIDDDDWDDNDVIEYNENDYIDDYDKKYDEYEYYDQMINKKEAKKLRVI